jgi:hypothetical protein
MAGRGGLGDRHCASCIGSGAAGRCRESGMADNRAASANTRRALRAPATVGELHKRGYQQLRIAPGMAPSGMYWRCGVAPASNIPAANGARLADWDGLARARSKTSIWGYTWPGSRVDGLPVQSQPVQSLATVFIERCAQDRKQVCERLATRHRRIRRGSGGAQSGTRDSGEGLDGRPVVAPQFGP